MTVALRTSTLAEAQSTRIIGRQYSWFCPKGVPMDDIASDTHTLDFLCMLVAYLRPRIIVESGTYLGHTAVALANILKQLDQEEQQPARVWTADPTDYGIIQQAILNYDLGTHLTYYHGSYDDMLALIVEPIGMAYIDASAKNDPKMRLRHVKTTLARMALGGVIVVDDCGSDWPGVKRIRQMASLYLPARRGLCVIQKAA